MLGRGFVFHFSFEAPVDDRTVPLAPTPHRRMIDNEAALRHLLLDITQAQRKQKVPADTRDDDF